MPIEFGCTKCGAVLRVPDETAGRQAKCPSCGNVQPVPIKNSTASTPAGASPSPFGAPMPSSGMSSAGGQPPQPAAGVPGYGQSPFMVQAPAQPQSSDNPYQSPSATVFDGPTPYGVPASAGPIVPTRVEIGDLMSRAWEIYKRNFWMCAAVAFIAMLLLQLIEQPISLVVNLQLRGEPVRVRVAAQICMFLSFIVIQAWFTGGVLGFFLETARGENPSIRRMFGCRGQYLSMLGFQFLFMIGTYVSLLGLIVGAFVFQAVFGLGYFFILDKKTGPIEAFKSSLPISWPNLGTNLLAMLVAFGVGILGIFACCIGVIFAWGYIGVLAATAYLMMSGQPVAGGYVMPPMAPTMVGDVPPYTQT